jgi:hypothetical protein
MMLLSFNVMPANWFWIVGGSATQVYSTAIGDYMPSTDARYVTWQSMAGGLIAGKVASEAELGGVLARFGLRPTNASVLSAYQAAAVTGMDAVQNKILFNLNNRLRVLEGQPTLTAAQFIAAMASLV